MLQTVQQRARYLPDFANAELMEQVLTERELKAQQSSKIREIGEALITAGFVSLNAQAKVFGLPRSTAWTILSAKHKGTGLCARIICRMLSSGELPALVRAKIMEYAEEKQPVFTVGRRGSAAGSPRSSHYGGYRSRLHDVVKGG